MTRTHIHLNEARRISDDHTVVVRLGKDTSSRQALALSCRNSPLYAGINHADASGLICISVWALHTTQQLEQLVNETIWDDTGLTRAGTIRQAGYEIIPTDVMNDSAPQKFNDWHHDIIVTPYPEGTAPYDTLRKSERGPLLDAVEPAFSRLLRLFEPRHPLPHPFAAELLSEDDQTNPDGSTM